MKKRIVSLLMAVLMTVSLLPTAAWAEVLEAEASEASQTPAVSDAQSYTEDIPVVCSDTDVDTALQSAGFTVPTLRENFNVDVPCWDEYNDLCRLDFNGSTGEMTLNMYAATPEAWNAAYEQSFSWFSNDTEVMCVVPYYAPDNARYYSVCMGGAADALYFANNYSDQKYGNGGNPVDNYNRGTAIASVSNGYITDVGEYTTYYMIVWYDANDAVIARYALKIHVQSEMFSHEICSTLDTALQSAGFTAPTLGENFDVDVPCWDEYKDLCSLNVSTGEMTLNLNAVTPEAWNAAYQQSLKDFGNETSDVVMCAIDYLAPDGAVRYASYIGRSASAARDFVENEGALTSLGGDDNCVTGTTPIAMVDADKGYITNMWDYTSYYLVVWYGADGEAIAKYALRINVESEMFLHSTTGTSATEALRNAGYTIPDMSQIGIELPQGLVEGIDYTIDYDQTTGHATVKLLPGDPTHWQQAFEDKVLDYNGDVEEAIYWFIAIVGFRPNDTADMLNWYLTTQDDAGVGSFISDTYTESFGWVPNEDDMSPGMGMDIAEIGLSEDGKTVSFNARQGSSWARCITVWADSSGNVRDKFMYTLSIEVDKDFDYTWNAPLSLEEQLANEGFKYPTMGDMETNRQYGYFYLDVPKGLEEDIDYTYTYDRTTGTLTINMLEGEYANWKAAYLNKVISEPETAYIDFGVNFSPAREKVDNVANDVGREAIQALLRGEYSGEKFYFEDLNYGYCGNGFTRVWLDSNDSAITLRAKQGAEELLYAVVWEDHDTHAVVAKYILKVVINVENGFSHTIKTPQVRDITADRIKVDDTNITGGTNAWNIVNKNGQLAFMPASGQTLAGIMNGKTYITSFAITSPGSEYTLQSYYVRQFRDGSNMEEKAPTGLEFEVDTHDNLVGSDTGTRGGTLRYTLRWSSDDPNLPDLVEKLNVRIGDYALGKTTVTGNAEMDSEPNILDVQNMYDHMTTNQTTSGDGNDTDQVDSELATYDINFDGSADIYDLQGLYEVVAQDKPLQ